MRTVQVGGNDSMLVGTPIIDLTTGKEGYVNKVISSVLFEVEFYQATKFFKVDDENKAWKFVY